MTQFDPIFAALQATGVRYVVVGGVAVNLHGYQRFTKDIDLVIELIPDQALKALEALQILGYKPNVPVKLSDFADPTIREGWVRDKGMMVFQMYICSQMNVPRGSGTGGFEAAELFQLRMALESTYEQRLQDVQDMLDFNAEAEAGNPRLRWAVEQLGR